MVVVCRSVADHLMKNHSIKPGSQVSRCVRCTQPVVISAEAQGRIDQQGRENVFILCNPCVVKAVPSNANIETTMTKNCSDQVDRSPDARRTMEHILSKLPHDF